MHGRSIRRFDTDRIRQNLHGRARIQSGTKTPLRSQQSPRRLSRRVLPSLSPARRGVLPSPWPCQQVAQLDLSPAVRPARSVTPPTSAPDSPVFIRLRRETMRAPTGSRRHGTGAAPTRSPSTTLPCPRNTAPSSRAGSRARQRRPLSYPAAPVRMPPACAVPVRSASPVSGSGPKRSE